MCVYVSVSLFSTTFLLKYDDIPNSQCSVMLSTMAAAFGISVSMLDTEISKCIASGRISAKIDKEGDAIENSVKYDKRSNQYEEVITKGDLVLNQIQKLARSLEM